MKKKYMGAWFHCQKGIYKYRAGKVLQVLRGAGLASTASV